MSPLNFVLALTLFAGFGMHSGRTVLTLYALKLGAPPYAIGLLAAASSAFPLVLSVYAGKLNDRLGARWPLIISLTGAGLAMLIPFFFEGLAAIYLAVGIVGLSFSFYNVALQNLVGVLSTAKNRVQSFGNFSMIIATATFVGPLIAGFSIDHSGHAVACLYVALIWMLPVVMMIPGGKLLPPGVRVEAQHKGSILATLKEPKVRRVLIICSLIQAGFDLFVFYLPVYATNIGLSASSIGVVLATFAAASFIVRMIIQLLLKRFSNEQLLAWAFYLSAASIVFVPLIENVALLASVAFIFGLGVGCGQPITMMLIFTQSEKGRSGETMGLRLTINHLTRVVGPMMFGVIATAAGLSPIFWLTGLMLGSGGWLSTRSKRE